MKLSQLLERRGGPAMTPTSFEYEQEIPTPGGEEEYGTRILNVIGQIETHFDPLGTGDSPAEYEFHLQRIEDLTSGQPVDPKSITPQDYKTMERLALQNAG